MKSVTIARPGAARLVWMDVLRGLAVILIIIGHTSEYPHLAGLADGVDLSRVDAFNHFFAPGRVQALLFLSGVLLNKSLRKTGYVFFEGKINRILVPFFVWTAIEYLRREVMLGGGVDSLHSVINLFIHPFLWYLEYLFLFYVVAYFLKNIPFWVIALGAFVAGVASMYAIPVLAGPIYYMTFFFLGAEFGRDFTRFELLRRPAVCTTLIAGMIAVGTAGIAYPQLGAKNPLLIPLHVVFLLGLICAMQIVADRRCALVGLLTWVGRRSIVVYVVHQTLAATLLGLFVWGGLSWPSSMTLALVTVITVCASVALCVVQDLPYVRTLFIGFPPRRRT